ncbi:Plasmodium vivax Vir protein, putative [Plasmodium vivax]|uniref:Vir protein, putative n=1 Tax=Plasmodium vivax TaxID=5855 RepID=A0A1G4E6X5_PLAVI|nr:Plasmodium vivax Vir protein, putative [Plasmodium vivax]
MSNSQQDPRYLSYHDYDKAKYEFVRTEKSNPNNERFQKIINEINSGSPKWNLNNETFIKLHNVLSNDPAFYEGITPNYCSYINHWLNKEVQNTKKPVDESYFPIFQKFSEKLTFEKGRRVDQSCNNYIFKLDHEIINIMDILYGLYDEYKIIRSYSEHNFHTSCNKLLFLAKNHNEAIDEYYKNDKKLYDKFVYIKKLIDGLTMRSNSPCLEKIYLNQPQEVIKKLQEEAQKQREPEEKQRRELEEKQRRERDEQQQREREEQQLRQQREEQQLRQQRERLKSILPTNGDVSGTPSALKNQKNDVSPLTVDVREEGLLANPILSREQQHLKGNKFTYSQTPLLASLGGQIEELEPSEVRIHEPENSDMQQSVTPGAFRSLQNSFSSFISEVEPGPVLGVSGGMGVLFLLFKYTPVGSFFGGRRGRFRQIPSSFRGFTPGDFVNIQEYGGGYVGYSPMDINPLAE